MGVDQDPALHNDALYTPCAACTNKPAMHACVCLLSAYTDYRQDQGSRMHLHQIATLPLISSASTAHGTCWPPRRAAAHVLPLSS
jgi:hypothetical protein